MSDYIVRTKIIKKTKLNGSEKRFHKEMARFNNQKEAMNYACDRYGYVRDRLPHVDIVVRRRDPIPEHIVETIIAYDADFIDSNEDGTLYSILISIERV